MTQFEYWSILTSGQSIKAEERFQSEGNEMNGLNPWTIPNLLTTMRGCIALWLIVTVINQPHEVAVLKHWAFVLFAFGAITDWVDGLIARNFDGQESKLGKYMDPPADKLLVISYMAYLYILGVTGVFELILFGLIAAREIGMLCYRWKVGADNMPVDRWGKWKATAQFVVLGLYSFLAWHEEAVDLAFWLDLYELLMWGDEAQYMFRTLLAGTFVLTYISIYQNILEHRSKN